jgi:5,10-methenyltetrahydromethanopterin hydrogenase
MPSLTNESPHCGGLIGWLFATSSYASGSVAPMGYRLKRRALRGLAFEYPGFFHTPTEWMACAVTPDRVSQTPE